VKTNEGILIVLFETLNKNHKTSSSYEEKWLLLEVIGEMFSLKYEGIPCKKEVIFTFVWICFFEGNFRNEIGKF